MCVHDLRLFLSLSRRIFLRKTFPRRRKTQSQIASDEFSLRVLHSRILLCARRQGFSHPHIRIWCLVSEGHITDCSVLLTCPFLPKHQANANPRRVKYTRSHGRREGVAAVLKWVLSLAGSGTQTATSLLPDGDMFP